MVMLFGASSVAQAFYLVNPLSYWPASSVSGNIVFQVGLVASPPNVPNPPLTDGSNSWDAAFVAQMNAWNALLPDAVLNLQAVVGSAVSPLDGDGVNNVFFSNTIYGDTWGSSTAGVCLSFSSGNRRTEADILFNSTKTWNAYLGNLQGSLVDFRRVALHELGHALLLDHPDDVGQSVPAIMNSTSSNTDALTADDTAGVARVFGALTPVVITVQPRPPTSTNSIASLNVTAAGSEPITYQWQRSTNGGGLWSIIPSVTFPTGSAGSFNNGDLLRVIATNPVGSVTSRPVTFTITGASAPNIDLDPANATISDGEDVVFTAHAMGSPAPAYQWQVSLNNGATWANLGSLAGSSDLAGSTTPSLRITRATASLNGFRFRAVATNSAGSDTSAAVTLTVNASGPASYFIWQPLDVYAQAGANVLVVAGTSGSPAPSRQWQRSTNGGSTWNNVSNDSTFSGVTTSTLTIAGVTTGMSGHLFRLHLSNSSGNATSRVVLLSVGSTAAAPVITDDPDNVMLAIGQTAAFAAAVTAFPAPVFQWELASDGINYSPLGDGLLAFGTTVFPSVVSGANTRALTITNVDPALQSYRFRLVTTNAQGADTSAAAILGIGAAGTTPTITTHPSHAAKMAGENATFTAAAGGAPAPALQWQRSTNGGGTWSNLANDLTFSGVTTGTLTATAVTLAINGHQFRAVASNTAGSANTNAATLTVSVGTPPAQPGTPTVGTTAYDSLTAQWPAVAGAAGYFLDVATDAAFTSFVAGYHNLDVGNLTSLAVTGLRLGTYYVRVRAYSVGGSSTSSATSTVNVGSRLLNLSTRGQTSPANPMIVGFYVSGSPKTLLVRVAAARLADVGVSGTLPNPRLRLVDGGSNTIASNDDWNATDPVVIAATAASGAGLQFIPGSVDSVIVAANLAVGGYTAIVESVTGAAGLVLVELYEIDEVGRLINISTRGLTVSAGASVMIPGTYFGSTSKRLLVRVVGETLGQFNGIDELVDPILEIYDGDSPSSPMLTNDDWDVNDTALVATWTPGSPQQVAGLGFANGSKDAAVLVVLPKNTGGYTIQAKSKNGATGTVLVELYEVP